MPPKKKKKKKKEKNAAIIFIFFPCILKKDITRPFSLRRNQKSKIKHPTSSMPRAPPPSQHHRRVTTTLLFNVEHMSQTVPCTACRMRVPHKNVEQEIVLENFAAFREYLANMNPSLLQAIQLNAFDDLQVPPTCPHTCPHKPTHSRACLSALPSGATCSATRKSPSVCDLFDLLPQDAGAPPPLGASAPVSR
jgi:hypothetical protein